VTFFPPFPRPEPRERTFREALCEEGSGVDVRVEYGDPCALLIGPVGIKLGNDSTFLLASSSARSLSSISFDIWNEISFSSLDIRI
jgi:hypothetical protein